MVEGLERIFKRLDSIAEAKGTEEAVEKAALLVERDARLKCPSGTGDLRASIESKVEKNGTAIIGTVYTPLQYGIYVEMGTGLFAAHGNGRTDVPWMYIDAKGEWHITSGQKPQPFMIPALNENRSRITEILAQGVANND